MNELLFWSHFLLVIGTVAVAWFVPLPVVMGLILVHFIHTIYFRGCLLTWYSEKRNRNQLSFFQQCGVKFFGKDIGIVGSQVVTLLVYTLAISLSILRY